MHGEAPPRVADSAKLARKLQDGQWISMRHECLGETPLQLWRQAVAYECGLLGMEIDSFDVPRKNITLIWNVEREPTFEQLRNTVSRELFARIMGELQQ